MRELKAVAILRHPPGVVWETLRDRSEALLPLLDDIEQITVREREERNDGTVRLLTLWRARPELPEVLAAVVAPEMLSWLDRAEWQHKTGECRWEIEPTIPAGVLRGAGVTRYEPAMGGRGTRVTFCASLSVDLGFAVPTLLETAVAGGVEYVIESTVPRSFRNLTEAVSRYLVSAGK